MDGDTVPVPTWTASLFSNSTDQLQSTLEHTDTCFIVKCDPITQQYHLF